MGKRIFLGQNDPDRITLEKVFPTGDLVFSMPFEEMGKHKRIAVEGSEEILEQFEGHASVLFNSNPDGYGRWITTIEGSLERPSLEIIYEPVDRFTENLCLLIFVLRADLVKKCHFRLCPISEVTVTKGHVTVLHKPAPLPESIGNGFLELVPPIVPPPIIYRVN